MNVKKQLITQLTMVVISCVLSLLLFFLAAPTFLKQPSAAYIINQEVFEGFSGTLEMQQELEGVQLKHQSYLDSLSQQLERSQSQKALEEYQTKSENFLFQEQELSTRFTQQVWGQINAYLKEFATAKGYDMILGADGSGSLMYAEEHNNITKEVITYINKKYDGIIE